MSAKQQKLRRSNSSTREAILKSKSRKEIHPGEKLTHEQIKNFDEAQQQKRQNKEKEREAKMENQANEEDRYPPFASAFNLFPQPFPHQPQLYPQTSLFMGHAHHPVMMPKRSEQ